MKPPDLSALSDEEIKSEWARRTQGMRKMRSGGRNGGRPRVPTPCPRCGVVCGGVKLAREHCRGGARSLYVDARDGLDTNTGLTPTDALRTLSAALDRKRAGDSIVLVTHP